MKHPVLKRPVRTWRRRVTRWVWAWVRALTEPDEVAPDADLPPLSERTARVVRRFPDPRTTA